MGKFAHHLLLPLDTMLLVWGPSDSDWDLHHRPPDSQAFGSDRMTPPAFLVVQLADSRSWDFSASVTTWVDPYDNFHVYRYISYWLCFSGEPNAGRFRFSTSGSFSFSLSFEYTFCFFFCALCFRTLVIWIRISAASPPHLSSCLLPFQCLFFPCSVQLSETSSPYLRLRFLQSHILFSLFVMDWLVLHSDLFYPQFLIFPALFLYYFCVSLPHCWSWVSWGSCLK